MTDFNCPKGSLFSCDDCISCGQHECERNPEFNECPACGRHMHSFACRWTDCAASV